MKAKSFTWHYAPNESPLYPKGASVSYVSYREAAKALGVSVPTVQYYEKKGIHCQKDKQWVRAVISNK